MPKYKLWWHHPKNGFRSALYAALYTSSVSNSHRRRNIIFNFFKYSVNGECRHSNKNNITLPQLARNILKGGVSAINYSMVDCFGTCVRFARNTNHFVAGSTLFQTGGKTATN